MLAAFRVDWSLVIITDVDCVKLAQFRGQLSGSLTAKTSWLNITVTPDQESAEDWLGQYVQNTVEHSLRVG